MFHLCELYFLFRKDRIANITVLVKIVQNQADSPDLHTYLHTSSLALLVVKTECHMSIFADMSCFLYILPNLLMYYYYASIIAFML